MTTDAVTNRNRLKKGRLIKTDRCYNSTLCEEQCTVVGEVESLTVERERERVQKKYGEKADKSNAVVTATNLVF